MKLRLTELCVKAHPLTTECCWREKPNSVTCGDGKTQSRIAVQFNESAHGIAFVTDHVIPNGEELSCDWCVCHCDASKTSCNGLLIELKGRDFKHAVQQLASTHKALKNAWPQLKVAKSMAVMSGHRIPGVKSSDYKIVSRYKLPGFTFQRSRKGLTVNV